MFGTPDLKCPKCGHKLSVFQIFLNDGIQRPPGPGDVVICPVCATVLQFVIGFRGLTFEPLSDIQLDAFPLGAKVALARMKVQIIGSRKIGGQEELMALVEGIFKDT